MSSVVREVGVAIFFRRRFPFNACLMSLSMILSSLLSLGLAILEGMSSSLRIFRVRLRILDDQGLAKVCFRLGGMVLSEQDVPFGGHSTGFG